MEYDFKALSDYDFELLCCDLLSALLKRPIESFRRGRDRGIDLRCASTKNRKIIIQCKHYANTPFSGLYSAMRTERAKIEKLQPEQYILTTSYFITTDEKDKLFHLLQPYCKSTSDIIGGNELNALLRQYPNIEQVHYKLWLTSTAVLQKIFQSSVYQQSEFLQAEIKEKLKFYVQSNTAYRKARNILHACNCCIISGIPGIGKTTLAEILLIYYLDQGYEIIKVRTDISEAIQAYRADVKQVFLYDDFLGSTALDMKMNKNEGKELLSFLRRISRQKGKKFILTTREYILNQARQSYEEFARQDFDYNKCIISLDDYSKADRARILYNHLYFYNVPKIYIEDLLTDGRILNIIEHPNYSPRLIETVTSLFRPKDEEHFYDFFIDTLNHPNKLWENAFDRQISPGARDLLLLLCSVKNSIPISFLKGYYEAYHHQKALAENRPLSTTDFLDALRETEGSFIKIDRSQVSYHNPSVRDFIQDYIQENDYEFRALCEGAVSFDQSFELASYSLKGKKKLYKLHREPFLEMIKRTISDHVVPINAYLDSCGRQMLLLSQFEAQVDFPELHRLILDFIHNLPTFVKEEQQILNNENWNNLDSPQNLKQLLEGFQVTEFRTDLEKEVYQNILEYALTWFKYAFLYSIDDFLLFSTLSSHISFSLNQNFGRVYNALEDFCDHLAPDDILDFDDESQCDDYLYDINSLETFYKRDFSDIKEMVEDRIVELQELAEEDDDDEYFTNRANDALSDAAILDMFQSLLYREQNAENAAFV